MIKLAFITQDFPPEVGGIQTYSYELAGRMHRWCDDFLVVAPKKQQADSFDRAQPFKIERINAPNSLLGPASIFRLLPIMHQNNIDTTFHSQWQTLPLAVAARKAGIVKHIFVAAHARELLFNPFGQYEFLSEWYEQYKRSLLKQVDYFFPVSRYTADLLEQHGVSAHRMKVVINGTDPEVFYPKKVEGLKKQLGLERHPVALTITRLVERKGIDTVFRAVKLMSQNQPELRYVVVGEGDGRNKLEQLSREMGIENQVIFTGSVPYEELNDYYNICDLFVMPSKTVPPDIEGFGIVFLEAGACAKPVIGSRSGGIPDAIEDGETGLLVDEQNPQQLAEAMETLLSNPEKAVKMGKKGRQRVLNKANWDHVATTIFKSIKDLL